MNAKKLLKNIISFLVYLAVLAGLIYGIPKALVYSLETPHPMASITSGSMWPSLKRGDLVLIKGIKNKKELEVGDIVVYENPRGFTIHRAVALKENILITKGDANNVNDSPVEYEQIIGRAVELKNKPLRLPYLGLISIFVSKYKNS
ncbi:MAG: signal peptidase I [Candidatus Portnoybacteria bacterium RIFCSPLOWO2_01_FULL_43_11]|uniref:Signal peptidase I n=4 Tax=Candidatus Portnoyibacteriota TaxID=1817913 RepID=A0A1G2FB48_9BACT|nr:MAG: signal peptidase I [Candidatus Portnoybacteria bacterium RIFCSPHIGHO2_01_FULL_40_12b]OGZ38330.1 MAG: signal peptidase I [Candidatus Portnoybacteria bacterium RIFCSPHIGHO2_12_FULL_40_11]OGZ38966.1 MAG: signal peptidase I [Candidatus Portnoybacteria bacterium RIFCSPLOWO2_01_FULL_43_11]OGZ40503.1 MAG: signal peptidase I [Candidatus Portnoybacteria bacterium RIFCSPLOWO2_02_FULL_40_15]